MGQVFETQVQVDIRRFTGLLKSSKPNFGVRDGAIHTDAGATDDNGTWKPAATEPITTPYSYYLKSKD